MINFNSFYFSIIHVFGVQSFQANVPQSAHVFTRNLTLHSAAPRAVLNFLFLVRELVLVNPDNALQECCNP